MWKVHKIKNWKWIIQQTCLLLKLNYIYTNLEKWRTKESMYIFFKTSWLDLFKQWLNVDNEIDKSIDKNIILQASILIKKNQIIMPSFISTNIEKW